MSSGGVAKAQFAQGTWSMELGVLGELGTVTISGDLNSAYTEKELLPTDEGYDPTAQKLDGRAVVNVLASDFSFLGGLWEGDVVWGNDNGLGGMIASILFPTDYSEITDYQTDYLSENVQITLLSDDQAIPEPATMALLVLGSLMALRTRKS
ncbi:MAG: PEP-CTERM sorting domain-containing protein [Planctomycetota bacterium]